MAGQPARRPAATRQRAVFLGCNALGDTLCTTPVVHSFRRRHPDALITYVVQNAGYCRVLDANPDIDLVLYNEHLWIHGKRGVTPEWLQSLPLALEEPAPLLHFDMDAVCGRAENFQEHIARGFSRLLDVPIASVRPIVCVTNAERRVARALCPLPYVVFSMHSNANPARLDGTGAKDWDLERWSELERQLRARRHLDVVAVGAETDPRPPVDGLRLLYGLPIKVVAALLEGAEAVVTLENGLAHLAAGVGARIVELYAPIVPLAWAAQPASAAVRVIYRDPRQIPVAEVWSALDSVIETRQPTRKAAGSAANGRLGARRVVQARTCQPT